MGAGAVALAVAGPVAVAIAWVAVRRGRGTVWSVMVPVLAVAGIAATLTGVVRLARDADDLGPLLFLGAGSGVLLYAATRAFLALARNWQRLGSATANLYANEETLPLAGAFVLAAAVSSPAEELLWRGVVFEVLLEAVEGPVPVWAPWIAAAIAWLGYVGANALSGSLPILLGAGVSGAVWSVLAITGVAAPIACHVVWTGLMILLPPRRP